MGLNLVPSGQDGVTVTVTPGDPATIRWPASAPLQVRVAAAGGTARFSMRGPATPDGSGVHVVPDGQAVTLSTRAEATPVTVRVAADTSVSVTVTGFRDTDTGVAAPYVPATTVGGSASKLSELTDLTKSGAAPGKVVAVATVDGGGNPTSWVLANPVTGGSGAVSSVAGKVGDVTLVKGDVGLNNVNNTADANKPISTAMQAALDAKVASTDARLTDQRTPIDGSVTDAKVPSNAAINLDKTADGTTNRTFTTAEKSKLAAVAAGATANATNAELRDAATHTGQRTSASISDFTEAVQDAVAALLGAGSNVTINYDDTANTLTIGATASGGTGLDAEQVRDAIGVALVGVGNIGVVVNDAADTITITTTATANATDAALRDRSTHTGQDPISAVNGLQTALDGKAPLASPAFTGTPTGITKSHVGLANVDNTSDANKPVSTATAAALASKADLDGSGKIAQAQIPAVAIQDFLGEAASQSAMLALTGQRGDYCTRTDRGTDWQLITEPATSLASWREKIYPASPVSSVNGRTGAVSGLAEQTALATHAGDTGNPHNVNKTQVGLSNVDNTSDVNKPVSAATQTALDAKAATTDTRFTDQRVPTDNSVTNAKVPTGAGISLDKTADGTINRVLTTAEKVKLAALEITGNVVHRLVEVNGVYPARPITGYVDYFGTVNPGNLLQPGDTWTQVASQAPSATAPGAPTNVVATPENGQATISFLAPASNGGAAITSYTVTATPGGLTKTGSASPILFTGLTNGTAYTFTVKATNSAGTSASSTASAAVTPGTVAFLPGNLVADRNMRYGAFVTDTGGTYRTMQVARVPVSGLTLTFGNWATLADPTGDTDNTNSYTIQKCYLEHGGTLTQVTFGGATSTSVPTGGSVRGTVTKTIAVGDTYYIRSYVTPDVSGGKYPTLSIGAKHYPGELSRKGADYANETGFANLNSLTDVFGPCAITGTVTSGTTKAVAVVGDSIAWGIGDSFSDSTRLGFIYRALNGNRAFLLFALPGESAQRFLTSRGDRRREYLGPAADYMICEHGVNDMQGSQTLAQCRANLLAVWSAALTRNPALKIYQTTLTPKSASTDSWATPENQTPDALVNSVRPSLNAWIRAGAPTVSGVGVNPGTSGALTAGQAGHPLKGYFEVADLAETARDSGKWKNGYTSDGVHPNPTGHAALVPAIDLTVLV